MLDRYLSPLIQPAAGVLARVLVRTGVTADQVSWAGFAIGLAAALAIGGRYFMAGLALMALSRACDALDGAVARQTRTTDRGGFLDISLDFLFYASIPLAFAIADPARNALPAAVLLAAFIGTGTSFLAFATLAAKRGLQSSVWPAKSLYFLGGLTEASETLACFFAMGLWPQHFGVLAYGFAALCGLTTATRIWWGCRTLA